MSQRRTAAVFSRRVHRTMWRTRRWASRRRRRLLEARRDWSRSRPALHDLDRILERHLPARPGYFVEAGACDGYFQSNTYSLERIHGWRGVLVEPVPFLARAAARDRSARVFNCALVSLTPSGEQILHVLSLLHQDEIRSRAQGLVAAMMAIVRAARARK